MSTFHIWRNFLCWAYIKRNGGQAIFSVRMFLCGDSEGPLEAILLGGIAQPRMSQIDK